MAFVLSVALFIYFWVVGYVIVFALYTRRDLVRSALLAPSVGIVATIYPIYVLSRLGLPVRTFAHALTAVTMIICDRGMGVVASVAAWPTPPPLHRSRHLRPRRRGLAAAHARFRVVRRGQSRHDELRARALIGFVDQPFVRVPDPDVWLRPERLGRLFPVFSGLRGTLRDRPAACVGHCRDRRAWSDGLHVAHGRAPRLAHLCRDCPDLHAASLRPDSRRRR